jgi:hypothetical protein
MGRLLVQDRGWMNRRGHLLFTAHNRGRQFGTNIAAGVFFLCSLQMAARKRHHLPPPLRGPERSTFTRAFFVRATCLAMDFFADRQGGPGRTVHRCIGLADTRTITQP